MRGTVISTVAVSRDRRLHAVPRLGCAIFSLERGPQRLGELWLEAHPVVPWRLVKGMRNRIAHTYWTVDDDIVWDVIEMHVPEPGEALADEIHMARSVLNADNADAASADADGT